MHNLSDEYLAQSSPDRNENANMAFSLQGLNNHLSSKATQNYWLEKLYTPTIRQFHEEGRFHIHDLNLLAAYCVGWDLADLLREGFRGARGKTESAPARHFRSALGQITNFFYTLQGETAGAQAFSSVDTLLAPLIAFDQLTYDEVKQAVQEWVFNLNVPTRVGFQTPFTNITLDWNVPERLKNEAVVWGGELQPETYGEFQNEMDLFNRAFLEVMEQGDAKGRVFTFPIPTYNIGKDFDFEDSRLLPLWASTAKYGLPYFANFINSDLSPDDARSMCCRLRLDTRKLNHRGGGLFGANPLTGSIGVVTLNLPHSELREEYTLKETFDQAVESLQRKRETLEEFTDRGLYPYSKFYLRDVKARTGGYWSNHFSTIGVVGLDDAMRYAGFGGLQDNPGRSWGLSRMDSLRVWLEKAQQTTGQQFNLEATPAEGASFRLRSLDKKRFNMYGADCYTNSSQLPVNTKMSPFELLDHQEEFQTKYTGGTVLHFWLGERISDPNVVKDFVRKVCFGYKIPYFTLTPTFSVCPEHGYLVGRQDTCPTCQAKTEVYSRVVGYMRPIDQWNTGKQKEFDSRSMFDI